MGEALDEIKKTLDDRYDVAKALLGHIEGALRVYQVRANTKKPEVNIPRCSKEHLAYIVKDLTEYTEELQRVRCGLQIEVSLSERDSLLAGIRAWQDIMLGKIRVNEGTLNKLMDLAAWNGVNLSTADLEALADKLRGIGQQETAG
jgi:hypothetical protein